MNPTLAGRPDVLGDRKSLTLYEGMQGMMENTFMNIKNRSSKITADLDIPPGGANGAILSQGGRFGGWSLYMKDGKPTYTYNFLGLARYTVAAPQALPPGPATVTLDFAYDGGGVGKGGKATLFVNGKPVAEGRIEKTQPNIFSADETADVGIDNQTPVAEGIGIGAGHTLHRHDQQDHPRREVGHMKERTSMKRRGTSYTLGLGLVALLAAATVTPTAGQGPALDRTVLPIPEPSTPRSPSSTRATPRRRRASR